MNKFEKVILFIIIVIVIVISLWIGYEIAKLTALRLGLEFNWKTWFLLHLLFK